MNFSMNDPERRERILNLLGEAWDHVPDWNFGKLLYIVLMNYGNIQCPEIFSIKDEELEKMLMGDYN